MEAIYEYLTRVLRFPNQNIGEQPSFIKCASTGAAAVRISGTTLHSAFKLNKKKLSNEAMHKLQHKYRYLKIVITDEISMTGVDTWKLFECRLREITGQKDTVYGGVSILPVGDFFQLPPSQFESCLFKFI